MSKPEIMQKQLLQIRPIRPVILALGQRVLIKKLMAKLPRTAD